MPSFAAATFEQDYDAGRADPLRGPVYVMLLAPDYEPSPAHARLADVARWEAAGAGYKAGGRPLVGRREEGGWLLADDVLWPRCTVVARGAWLYQAGGDGCLIAWVEFKNGAQESVRGEFEVLWPEGRVLELR